jgi:hypothetical protein
MWIEARERGEAGDHPRAAAYERLGRAIAELPAIDGGLGWRDGLLDQLALPAVVMVRSGAAADAAVADAANAAAADAAAAAAARRARARRRRGLVAGLASTVALAAISIVVLRPKPAATPAQVASRLELQVEPGPQRRAAAGPGTAAIGDTLTFAATFARDGALWIYDGDRLVLRCPGATGCAETAIAGGRRLTASVRADAALTYTAWLVEGRDLAPQGSLATDAERFLDQITQTSTIDIR